MTKILIIEDDSSINKILSYALKQKDYLVDSLYNGKEAVEEILDKDYDLVLVDWMLPYKSGIKIIKESRENGYTKPMILLTARSDEEDIIKGLEAGADDYLTKPFKNTVLLARINAHLRRYYKHFTSKISFEDVVVDDSSREVYVNQEQALLTKVEYDLLKMFMTNIDKTLSRDELLNDIWGFEYDGDTRLVDVHVFKLKNKLRNSKLHFKSVRGVGYRLVKKDE